MTYKTTLIADLARKAGEDAVAAIERTLSVASSDASLTLTDKQLIAEGALYWVSQQIRAQSLLASCLNGLNELHKHRGV